MATSVELRHERANLWEQMKALNTSAETEKRDLSAEEREQWDRIEADIAALDGRIERAEKLERAPAAPEQAGLPAERPSGETRDAVEKKVAAYREAFQSWAKFGVIDMPAEQRQVLLEGRRDLTQEVRAMGIGADNLGGYLAPAEFQNQIEKAMSAFGGMREAATIRATDSGVDLPMPVVNDTGNRGRRLGEHATVTTTDVTVGQRVLRAYMYSSDEVLVSLQLMQDSATNIEDLLRDLLAERIGRATNLDFTTGAGADSPIGIVTDAVSGVTAAAQNAVTADELIDLEYSVDRAYRPRGKWMAHSNTIRDIRKLKDGDGRYLWQPGLQAGQPNVINSYPYIVNDDMPTMATTAKAILFGDLGKYVIRDVRGFTLVRLNERHAENFQVAFIGYSRHDGKLLDAGTNPVKCITMA